CGRSAAVLPHPWPRVPPCSASDGRAIQFLRAGKYHRRLPLQPNPTSPARTHPTASSTPQRLLATGYLRQTYCPCPCSVPRNSPILFSFKSSPQRAIVAGNAHVSAELPAKHRQAKAKPLIHTARFRRPAPSSCTTLAPRRRPL